MKKAKPRKAARMDRIVAEHASGSKKCSTKKDIHDFSENIVTFHYLQKTIGH